MEALADFKKWFDPLLAAHLEQCVGSMLVHHERFKPVGEHLTKLAAGGKRLRPFVLDLAYQTAGGKDRGHIVPALLAIELFQTFAIIHDDIIDGADVRHGIETIHVKFGLKQAIMVGDQCLAWAMKAIALAPQTTSQELSLFMQLVEETNTGQMLDISLEKARDVSEQQVDASIELKTARYTFIYPTLIGLSYAGYDDTELYRKLGLQLGRAFQRLDDLFDVMADEVSFGKKPGADIAADMPTHLSLYYDKHATVGQREIMSVYRGRPLDKHDMARVKELFIVSGAADSERQAILSILDEARSTLASMPMPQSFKATWHATIDYFRFKLSTLRGSSP